MRGEPSVDARAPVAAHAPAHPGPVIPVRPAAPPAAPTALVRSVPPVQRESGATISLRRVKVIGVIAPVLFGIAVETLRFTAIVETPLARAEHFSIAVITGIGVVGFAFLMFSLIERAQRDVLRQNRELAALTAVSTAVRGELEVEGLIDSALRSVLATTGAVDASVVVCAREGSPEAGLERRVEADGIPPTDLRGLETDAHLVDIPLANGPAVVGQLRLRLLPGVAEPDLLASSTLQGIGHQLACAIQIGQLVADLQRRKSEGHGLYDVLLRVSNQEPLLDALGAVARHARELVGADAAAILLTPAASVAVGLTGSGEAGVGIRAARGADGETTIAIDGPGSAARPAALGEVVELALGSPELAYGALWVARSGGAFTGRERGFVSTLGEVASIAISAARHREREQQAAVVAERERIAREMHDSLAQVLGVTHLRLLALRGKVASGGFSAGGPSTVGVPGSATGGSAASPDAVTRELDELAALAEDAYRDVREAILGLREAARTDRGFVEGLRAYLEKYRGQSGIAATLETELDGDPVLAPRAEIQVIRVVQEALTNVRKHAGATRAVVRLASDGEQVTLTIEDDGRGFDLGRALMQADSGYGLHTMRERMELLGGTLTVDSAPGRGTRVVATLPALRGAVPAQLVAAGDDAPAAVPA